MGSDDGFCVGAERDQGWADQNRFVRWAERGQRVAGGEDAPDRLFIDSTCSPANARQRKVRRKWGEYGLSG